MFHFGGYIVFRGDIFTGVLNAHVSLLEELAFPTVH